MCPCFVDFHSTSHSALYPWPHQVGGLVIGDSTDYFDGFEPCSDSEGGVSKVLVGVLIGAAVAAVAVCLGCFLRRRSKNKKSIEAMEADLGGFGSSKAASTL